jgi:HAD superfamily hydrolase (TIGR01459 family)
MRRIVGLTEIAAGYDSLLCDVWGVLHNGVAATMPACDALRRFREGGGTVMLITNAPRPGEVVLRFLDRVGVPHDAYDGIVSSGDVTRDVMAARPDKAVFHIGPERDLPIFDGLGLRFVPLEQADYAVCTGLRNDEVETPESYRAELGRLRARRLFMLCGNPDLVVERGDRLVYCAGALARLYAELGGEAILVGKPHRPIYEAAEALVAALGGRNPLAVGDGLLTDIRGAVDNRVPALFIAGGIHAHEFGPPAAPDPARIAARLAAEKLTAVAYMPKLAWDRASEPA